VLKGLLAGGITLGVAAVFPEPLVFTFLTVILGVLLGVYPGLAMANPEVGRPVLQWGVAVLITAVALTGIATSPLLLVVAFLLHGAWSLLQKFTALGDGVPEGFLGFSATYDLVLGGFSLFVWSAGA